MTSDLAHTASSRAPARRAQLLLAVEFAAVFGVLPVVVWILRSRGVRLPIIPMIVGIGLLAWIHLRNRPDFDRRAVWHLPRTRAVWVAMGIRFALAAVLLTAIAVWFGPDEVLSFPRRRPGTWAIVMLGYPLLSVLPQEIVYRAFVFHRYRPLFGTGLGIVTASALAFGHVHIVFGHWQSLLLSTLGGLLFGATWRRT